MAQETRDLAALIHEARSLKTGNRDFALFSAYGDMWEALLGNPQSGLVPLGEGSGDVWAEGASPEEAVQHLITTLRHKA